ncbi:nucleotide disphospho-sugar-binding domain-containing protein [Streptomyces sp. FR-108]|uniref:nucleotide disphospho-sugar-binding domain-containing protein n=1 Tax=Streptomyces sp. FR-108 TaxID=3416665 RepID=UPI003CF40E3C
MRVLFVTMPFKSHLQPMVPLAWALRAAGHEVQVAGEPAFLDTINRAGLTAVAVGPEEPLEQRLRSIRRDVDTAQLVVPDFDTDFMYEIGNEHRDTLSWEHLTWIFDRIVVPMAWVLNDEVVDDLVAYCRSWQPDLVLCDVLAHAGAVAADVVGAAHGRTLFWLDATLRLRHDFLRAWERQPPGRRPDMLRDWYAEWAGKYGRDFKEELITGQFAVNVLPERCRLEPHERTLPVRYVPHNDRSVLPSWLHGTPGTSRTSPAAGPPRVLLTFGLLAMQWAGPPGMTVEQLQETLDALAGLDIELVVTVPDEVRGQLHDVPENTRIVNFVPLDLILPTCAALIHHGGAGSFNGALAHGIPQLLLEYTVDAPGKGMLVRQTHVGLSLPPGEVTGARIREGLTRLLADDSFREGAELLRQEALALPPPSALVPELERVTAEHRARRPRVTR